MRQQEKVARIARSLSMPIIRQIGERDRAWTREAWKRTELEVRPEARSLGGQRNGLLRRPVVRVADVHVARAAIYRYGSGLRDLGRGQRDRLGRGATLRIAELIRPGAAR